MDYGKRILLQSIKLDMEYLEKDDTNYYPLSRIKEILDQESFDDYKSHFEEMKSDMPRFMEDHELNGEARDVWRMIKECYRKMGKYEKRKKEDRKIEAELHREEEKASELYEALEEGDKRPFCEDENMRLRYSDVRVDFELPVAVYFGHGMWDIEQVKNYCQRKFISSKIDELERLIAGPQEPKQIQCGLDLARSRMKELGILKR